MPKMIRASKKVAHLGINISRGLWGYTPDFNTVEVGVTRHSQVFKTEEEAVNAVLNGFRPTIQPKEGKE